MKSISQETKKEKSGRNFDCYYTDNIEVLGKIWTKSENRKKELLSNWSGTCVSKVLV